MDQVLDLAGRHGIERRARLVHQQDFGLGRDGAGDAQPLLLAARHAERALVEAVFHLVPQRRTFQRAFASFFEHGFVAHAVDAQGINHVLEDRHRERVGFLKHHAHALAQGDYIRAARVDIVAVQFDGTVDVQIVDQVVHAVDATKQG